MSNVVPIRPDWRAQLNCDANGRPRPKSILNARLFATHHEQMAGCLRFCELTKTIHVAGVPWDRRANRPWCNRDATEMRCWFDEIHVGLSVGVQDCEAVALVAAYQNSFHPIRDYLTGLRWDGIPRIDTWLTDYAGARESNISRSISARVLIAAVARVMQPGCKYDDVLVIEGAQGTRKSSMLPALFGADWTRTGAKLFDDPARTAMLVAGTWCVELAEFAAIQRVDTETVKSLITTQHDDVRLPYGRHVERFSRASIFVATVNPGDCGYLRDPTGNRRYWPVRVRACDTDRISADRDKLWAEAIARYSAGEQWWCDDDIVNAEQVRANTGRLESDPWMDSVIRNTQLMGQERLTVSDVLGELNVPTERRTRGDQMRVAKILQILGYKLVVTTVGGRPMRVYERGD